MDDQAAFRLDRFTAEFASPATEEDFRAYVRDRRVHDTRIAIFISAVFYLGFSATDYLAMGDSEDYRVIFLTRLGVCTLGLLAALFAARYWRELVNGLIPTVVAGLAMAGYLAITLLRPYEPGWHGMGMMAMLLGVYVFVPNRFLPALLLSVSASLVFLPMTALHFALDVRETVTLSALLAVINILGGITAYRISRLMREEYRDAAVLQAANDRLRREMEERGRLEAAMRRLAERDETTGVYNRRRFFELAEEALRQAGERGENLSALIMDVDYFKQLNGTYGHLRGDEILASLMTVCDRHLGPDTIFGRLGGEEFAALLPGVLLDQAADTAERIRDEALRTPVDVAEVAVFFTISAGVAQWRPGEPINVLLRRADEAMAAAKYRGRNRVERAAP